MPRKNDSVEKMINSITKGFEKADDVAARNMITVGTFIVVSDVTYRIAQFAGSLDIDVDMPSGVDIFNAFSNAGLRGMAWDVVTGDKPVYRTPLGNLMKVAGRTIDITADVDAGLWDFKYTAFAAGALSAGLMLLFANHPEWVSESIDAAQRIAEKAQVATSKLLENMAASGGDMNVADITALVAAIGPILGAATAIPGVPPPP